MLLVARTVPLMADATEFPKVVLMAWSSVEVMAQRLADERVDLKVGKMVSMTAALTVVQKVEMTAVLTVRRKVGVKAGRWVDKWVPELADQKVERKAVLMAE
jgi:hypothetical protein